MLDELRQLRRLRTPETVRFWRNYERILHPTGWRYLLVPLYAYQNWKILRRNNAAIPCKEQISPFLTPHGLSGIFISSGALIGSGCTVFQQVTIGSNTLPDSRGAGAPRIGKNVFVGAGAKIIGNVTVGDNVRIGANCVVTSDIPDNATVVLPAPRVICHDAPRENTFLDWSGFLQKQDSK